MEIKPVKATGDDKIIIGRYIAHGLAAVQKMDEEKIKAQVAKAPEMLCWIDLKFLGVLLDIYELTGASEHLRSFDEAFKKFERALGQDEDGFIGWYGHPIDPLKDPANPDVIIDEIQTSFRAMGVLSRWVRLVQGNRELQKEFSGRTRDILELVTGHLFKKWDARGYWEDLGARGGIYHWNKSYNPSKRFQTLPHEKHSIMVEGLLELYHATEDDQYLKRAVQIGTWFKNGLKLEDGHYWWHYWEPGGSWDIDTTQEDAWRHWIGPEPKPMWYNASLSIALSLYQHGLVFNGTDLARFLKTQKEVCWNGNKEKPEWFLVNGKPAKGQMLSFWLALYDKDMEGLVLSQSAKEARLKQSENPWKGSVGMSGYIDFRFLAGPKVKKDKRPFSKYGKQFIKTNEAFYNALDLTVEGQGYITPLKPSQMK